jgi:hypothetical protein
MSRLPLLSVLMIWCGVAPAAAQNFSNRGQASTPNAAALTVASTSPVIAACKRSGQYCFRLAVQITTDQPRDISVATPPSGSWESLEGTTAFTGAAASCTAFALGGLPGSSMDFNGRLHWNDDAPFAISQQKRGLLVLEFRCDEPVVADDEVQVQITLAMDPDGRGIRIARYVLPDLKLRAR